MRNTIILFKRVPLQLLVVLTVVFGFAACHVVDDASNNGGGDGDTIAPVSSVSLEGGTYTPVHEVELSCADEDGGSGCAVTYYYLITVGGGGAPPAVASVYTGPITIAFEGTTELKYFSIDDAGNRESVQTVEYIIEGAPPVTTATVTSAGGPPYSSALEIELLCTDDISGCDETYYTIIKESYSTSPESVYTGTITIDFEGTTEVKFFSIDGVGKQEQEKSVKYEIEGGLPPVTTASLVSGRYNSAQVVELQCVDDISGCYETYFTTDGSAPTSSSQVYQGNAIAVDKSTVLRFFSVDNTDQDEAVTTERYFLPSPFASGMYNSYALEDDGTVWSWGYNVQGQLGNGVFNAYETTPAQVFDVGGAGTTLSGVSAIAAGGHHALAIVSDQTVRAWGQNNMRQLGDSTINDRSLPVTVQGLGNVAAVAVGRWHSLAIKADGTTWAWGDNRQGQLGNATTGGTGTTPAQVCVDIGCTNYLDDVAAVAAGYWYSVALMNDGTVLTWGGTLDGIGGDTGAPGSNSNIPIAVSGLDNVIAISGGRNHVLALKGDGTVWAWGYNAYGQLGDGTNNSGTTPVQVVGVGSVGFLNNVVDIAGGREHSLALGSDGMVVAWGLNEFGQLGDLSVVGGSCARNPCSLTPVQVVDANNTGFLTEVVAINNAMAHSAHSLALDSSGTIWAWGRNQDGELGIGTSGTGNFSSIPVQVITF